MTALEVQIEFASRPMPGELESGDQIAILRHGDRWVLVVADGVGHGPGAATAARAAIASIARDPWGALTDVVQRCHREIAHTHGAAVSILRLEDPSGAVSHVGVGNVEVTGLTSTPLCMVPTPGIVGRRLRKVVATSHRLHPGDLLVLHTDGVSRRLELPSDRSLDARTLARNLLERYASPYDDAACLVLRC